MTSTSTSEDKISTLSTLLEWYQRGPADSTATLRTYNSPSPILGSWQSFELKAPDLPTTSMSYIQLDHCMPTRSAWALSLTASSTLSSSALLSEDDFSLMTSYLPVILPTKHQTSYLLNRWVIAYTQSELQSFRTQHVPLLFDRNPKDRQLFEMAQSPPTFCTGPATVKASIHVFWWFVNPSAKDASHPSPQKKKFEATHWTTVRYQNLISTGASNLSHFIIPITPDVVSGSTIYILAMRTTSSDNNKKKKAVKAKKDVTRVAMKENKETK